MISLGANRKAAYMKKASAADTGHSISSSLQFRRVRIYQVLALLALALAGFALFSPLIPALAGDTSLRIPSLTGAIGLLAAFVLLRALCMSTITALYFIMVPVIGLTLGAVSAFISPQLVPPVSVIAVFAAAYVLFYEQGLMVEISETGFQMVSRFPLLKRVLISWNEIETVTADLRVITTRFVGESYGMTDQKNRLVVRGNGKTILLGTPPIGGSPGLISMIRDGSRPSIHIWLLPLSTGPSNRSGCRARSNWDQSRSQTMSCRSAGVWGASSRSGSRICGRSD